MGLWDGEGGRLKEDPPLFNGVQYLSDSHKFHASGEEEGEGGRGCMCDFPGM